MLLILFQTLAVLGAVFLAAWEIESILLTGPLLSLTAVVLAVRSFRRNRPLGLYLGLATPTLAVVCFALICGLRWGPSQAARPVATILIVYAMVHLPVAVGACGETTDPSVPPLRPVQFSIGTLLVVMFVVALLLGLAKADEKGLVALGTVGAAGVILAHVLWQFHAGRPARARETPETLESPP